MSGAFHLELLHSGKAGDESTARPFDVLLDTFSLHEFMIRKVRDMQWECSVIGFRDWPAVHVSS
eukprot:scaffold98937_cov17-Tisochrysis_lutea.AAC.1